jgi:DNA polymerase-3 subunit beta
MPKGELEIEYSDQKTTIRHSAPRKKIQYRLNSPVPNFPSFPTLTDGCIFNVPSKDFKEMIRQTLFAVSDDETKYYINGVFFEQIISKTNDKTLLAMIATDGRRLAYVEKETVSVMPVSSTDARMGRGSPLDFKGVIIKPKILTLFTKLAKNEEGPVSVCLNAGSITLRFGSYELWETLIEGTFPNYRRVIPETQKYSLSFDRCALLDTFTSLLSGVPRRICLKFTPGTLSVYSTYSRNEEEHIPKEPRKTLSCAYEGEELSLFMDVMKLKESLEHLGGDTIQFCFTNTGTPVTIKSEVEDGSFHLIMPMQGIGQKEVHYD